MADAANKYAQNAAGKFYVDDQCIDCDLCRETAPANFTRSDDGGHSYLFKQPENDEELRLCEEAKTGCPVEAIGDDGASESDAQTVPILEGGDVSNTLEQDKQLQE